ncbi:MAG: hypothetical protein H6716_29195 [Polyangiaceae bacterium]|nr:hypothetical protein [Polyangiaceae bacterium]
MNSNDEEKRAFLYRLAGVRVRTEGGLRFEMIMRSIPVVGAGAIAAAGFHTTSSPEMAALIAIALMIFASVEAHRRESEHRNFASSFSERIHNTELREALGVPQVDGDPINIGLEYEIFFRRFMKYEGYFALVLSLLTIEAVVGFMWVLQR